jgi:arylsulfatase A-like enzyme
MTTEDPHVSRRQILSGAAIVAGATAVSPAAFAEPSRRRHRRPKHVILVDWDGFDPDYLDRAPTPNLDALARMGSRSVLDGTFPTISNPSRATTATGAWPEVHGNVAYIWDPATNAFQGQSRFLAAETIAQRLAATGRTVASVQWYIVQNYGTTYGDPEHLYVQPGGGIELRTDVAIDILNRRPVDSDGESVTVPKIPDFLAVYSSDLDGLGHSEGAESPNLPALLAEHDRQLGRLVQATKEVGIYDDTAFLLTGDHGMTTWTTPIGPKVLEAISAAGYKGEIVTGPAAPDTDVVMVQGGGLNVYLRGGAAGAEKRIRGVLDELPEIRRVFRRKELDAMHASPRLGQLVAEAKRPYSFAMNVPPNDGVDGLHGTTGEIRIPLFVGGAGIGRHRPRRPRLVDIAPTIAALFGIAPPAGTQGRTLTEVLD